MELETDLVGGSVAVITGSKNALPLPTTGGTLEMDRLAAARVFRTRPDQAAIEGETTTRASVPSLGELEIRTTSWFSQGASL
jgi:hypothetical protein